ncbi:MAG: flagellar hook-associated protein FlgL [Desulfuromonadales bacterium]|nr:flagellar hook-associated protein FlgL [Desulfuromonadales bacterium]MBN2792064.1 flagellar hook-associated protein FlgL [Desulfuromonadales bacterium]
MRATSNTTYRSLQAFLDRTSEKMQTLQLAAATGKKLNRPSDDPTAISPVLSARTQIQASDRYIETIESGLDRIDGMDGYMDSIENTLVRIKEISIATVNGSLSQADLETYADEVHQLRQALIDDANSQIDGKYLFAGFEEKTKPFELNPNYPATESNPVNYLGDNGALEFEIAPNELIGVNLTGNGLMLGDFDNDGTTDAGAVDIFALVTTLEEILRGQPPEVAGPTAATVANGIAGTQAEIQNLDFSATSLEEGYEVVLTVDGTEYSYVNSTGGLLTGADLAAAIAADLSISGYTLTDGGGGVVTFAQNVGNESDILPISTTISPTVEAMIDPLEDAANQVRSQRSLKGNVGRRLETARDHMEEIKIDMEEYRSRFEDADILETITELQQQEESFQAALSVTGRVSELSILDYI